MRTIEQADPNIVFPVVTWKDDAMFRSREPAELYILPKSSWAEMDNLHQGQWHLIDAAGRRFDIARWEQIQPFGGIRTVLDRIVGRIFAVPVLVNARQLSLEEFKQTLADAAWGRFQFYQPEVNYRYGDFQQALPKAQSYAEAIGALPYPL